MNDFYFGFGTAKIVWYDCESEFDVYDGYSETENAESECCGYGCEDCDGNCEEEEERQDNNVKGAEQLHDGSLID